MVGTHVVVCLRCNPLPAENISTAQILALNLKEIRIVVRACRGHSLPPCQRFLSLYKQQQPRLDGKLACRRADAADTCALSRLVSRPSTCTVVPLTAPHLPSNPADPRTITFRSVVTGSAGPAPPARSDLPHSRAPCELVNLIRRGALAPPPPRQGVLPERAVVYVNRPFPVDLL